MAVCRLRLKRAHDDVASRDRPDRCVSSAAKLPEAEMTRPTDSRGMWLVSRRHIDLLRVSSAICRVSC